MQNLLVGVGSLIALVISGFLSIYLAAYALSGRPTTTQDVVVGVLMAAVAVSAAVVLVRLYRSRPVGWLAVFVLLVGLGLPALLSLPYLFGVPFVLDF